MNENSTETTEPDASAADDNRSISERSDDPQEQRLSDEAAKWRREYRAADTHRLIAEARVADMQTKEINRILATQFAAPDDFWLASDATLEDLTTDGEIDAEKVAEAAAAVLDTRPHWRATLKPVGAPASAVTGDGKAPKAAEQPTWAGLLKGTAAG